MGLVSAATVTVQQGPWDLYRGSTKLSSHTTEVNCIEAAKALDVTQTYICRARTTVSVVQTTEPPPPECTAPQPPAETRSVNCVAPTTGTWTQTRSYTASAYPECWAAGEWMPDTAPAGACTEPPPTPSGGTSVSYTDLAYAPPNALVTVFGFGLDAAVTGAEVVSQSATKTVLKWTGSAATIGGVAVPVTSRAGRVLEATASNFGTQCNSLKSGDVLYVHAGSVTQRCGVTTWGSEQITLGTKFANTAIVGYPGEAAPQMGSVRLDDGNGQGTGITIAGLKLKGTQCLRDGSWWETNESGPAGGRFVNNDCFGNYGSSNTMTGLINIGGDGVKVFGNHFSNNAPSPINNNHAVYINVGADDVEVGWNKFDNMKMGHVIQQHTDGTARLYERISIHDNELSAGNNQDMRGINISGCTSDSTADIYNNVLTNVGQQFSGIMVYCGKATIRQNTLSKISGPTVNAPSSAVVKNNILLGGAATGGFKGTDNVTTGTVDADGHPTTPTHAPNVGINMDHAGAPRGSTVTVGAYE